MASEVFQVPYCWPLTLSWGAHVANRIIIVALFLGCIVRECR